MIDPDTSAMTAADHFQQPEGEDGSVTPDQTPVTERLESALGGDLTRFLLSALAGAQPASREEPR